MAILEDLDVLKHRNGLAAVLRHIREQYPEWSVAREALNAAAKELSSPALTLHAAAEYACQHLPEGYEARIEMEQGAGGVSLWTIEQSLLTRCDLPDPADKTLSEQLVEAVAEAIRHKEEGQ